MGLFQRRQNVGDHAPLYSAGLSKSVLIVGLGNVGKDYDGTRHNIGFAAVDALAASQDFEPWATKKDLKSHVTTATIGDARVVLVKPTTMMNLSGQAVQAVSNFYKIPSSNIVAVHDELDIDFGQIRTRIGGSSAGNNGVKSLIQHLGEGFGRVRIGVGPKAPTRIDSADFVLGKFNKQQQEQLKNLLQETTAILTEYIHAGQLPAETRSFIV